VTALLFKASITRDTARGQGLVALATACMQRLARAERARSELSGMTDVELKDIGLTRGEIGAVVNGRYRR
jgi:uncharacterized protein YjiS (DUF1127 family)